MITYLQNQDVYQGALVILVSHDFLISTTADDDFTLL